MILPTYTKGEPGPYYTEAQILFEFFACIAIYTAFISAQTIRHREYFITEGDGQHENNGPSITSTSLIVSIIFLLVSLTIVVLLAKTLSHPLEGVIVNYGLPKSLVGVIIAGVILLPEGIAAVNAARKNKLQTSLNLALGSAIASIGLTIPIVSLAGYTYDLPLILGLDTISIILLVISVFTIMLSLIGGRAIPFTGWRYWRI